MCQKKNEIDDKVQNDEDGQDPDDLLFNTGWYTVGERIERFPKQRHSDGQKHSPKQSLAYADTSAKLESMVTVIPERVVQSSGKYNADKKFQSGRRNHDEQEVEKIQENIQTDPAFGGEIGGTLEQGSQSAVLRSSE